MPRIKEAFDPIHEQNHDFLCRFPLYWIHKKIGNKKVRCSLSYWAGGRVIEKGELHPHNGSQWQRNFFNRLLILILSFFRFISHHANRHAMLNNSQARGRWCGPIPIATPYEKIRDKLIINFSISFLGRAHPLLAPFSKTTITNGKKGNHSKRFGTLSEEWVETREKPFCIGHLYPHHSLPFSLTSAFYALERK